MDGTGTPEKVSSNAGLGPLVPCPLCGSDKGYTLSEGSTSSWFSVRCRGCGKQVSEAQCMTTWSVHVLGRTPEADDAWNAAGAHAQKLRIGFERYEAARRMNPHQWADAWKLNISTGKGFDEIVDDMRPFLRA